MRSRRVIEENRETLRSMATPGEAWLDRAAGLPGKEMEVEMAV